jgi:hypothetical protein
MPPADAAPDPPDRPAQALAAELTRWCDQYPQIHSHRYGAWLPGLPWGDWYDWQRDLARRLTAAALAASGQLGRGRATMTAEERAAAFARAWGSEGIPRGGLAVALAAAFREAEAAAAARQREADAAVCRAVLEFWDRDSPAPGPYEAGAVAAAEMCVERIMTGGPAAGAGGGGAGGGTTE